MQVPSFRKTLLQQRYQWRTSVTTIMGWEWGPQRYNIRIMTVLSPYHTWGEVLNFCQIASESRGTCHVCERTSYTRGHGGRRVWKQPLWSCWRERVSAPSQTETVKSLGFFFLIKKCNQSMFNPTWQRGRWRWMLLLGGAPVVWGPRVTHPLELVCYTVYALWRQVPGNGNFNSNLTVLSAAFRASPWSKHMLNGHHKCALPSPRGQTWEYTRLITSTVNISMLAALWQKHWIYNRDHSQLLQRRDIRGLNAEVMSLAPLKVKQFTIFSKLFFWR